MSSLQERTLVVKGYDPNRITKELLEELFIQGGPVKNIVFRPDHSFVEFEDRESVGFALALFKGLELFRRPLIIEPKLNEPSYFKYVRDLDLVYNQLMIQRNAFVPPNTALVGETSNFVGRGGGGILPLNPNASVFVPQQWRVPQMIDNYNNRNNSHTMNDWNHLRDRMNDDRRRDFETFRNNNNDADDDDLPASSSSSRGRIRDRSRSPVNSSRDQFRPNNRDNNHRNNRDYNNGRRNHGRSDTSHRYDRNYNDVRGRGRYNSKKW